MERISYAVDFVSFLIQNVKDLEKVNQIILFGSVARGESNKDSDIDLFVDSSKLAKLNVDKIKERFFSSVKFRNYWKPLGIENELNIIVGNVDDWKLKDSFVGSSIILYKKYSPDSGSGESKVLLSWESPKKNSHRVMLNKNLFGYKHYSKTYDGIISKNEKVGANTILIKSENLPTILHLFKRFKVFAKIKKVFEEKI